MEELLMVLLFGAAFIMWGRLYERYSVSRQREKEAAFKSHVHGFIWIRFPVEKFVHKYKGEYLYVCERVPLLDEKVKNLPEE